MALMKCADCGNEVSSSARQCPKCGRPVRQGEGEADRQPVHDLPEQTIKTNPVEDHASPFLRPHIILLGVVALCFIVLGTQSVSRLNLISRYQETLHRYETAAQAKWGDRMQFSEAEMQQMEREQAAYRQSPELVALRHAISATQPRMKISGILGGLAAVAGVITFIRYRRAKKRGDQTTSL